MIIINATLRKTPGLYTVIVANNTANTDVAVCATGVLKLYAQ